MNIYKLFIGLYLSFSLSGCVAMATTAFDNYAGKGEKERTVVKDKIIAIGKPSKPIPNHEHDLLLVGKKYGYLATVIEPKNKLLFEQVFSTLDLKALKLDLASLHQNEELRDMTIHLYGSSYKNCPTPYGCYRFKILFDKSITKVKNNEKQQLKNLGFDCTTQKGNLSCSQKVRVGLTPVNQVKNINKLEHKLQEPINFKVIKLKKNKGISTPLYYAILPLTIAIDVITSPIQCEMVSYCDEK